MQVTREDLNRCTVRLNVVCDPERVKSSFDRAKKQLAKKVRLPGFRPGHAPLHLVEQYLDQGAVAEQAVESLVSQAYREAVEQEGLQPDTTVSPQIEVTKIEDDACEFTAKIGLPPVVELGKYEGIDVERPSREVTEEDIDRYIEELRRRRGTRVAVTNRGAEEGDVAVVNIRLDGEEGDGRKFMTIVGRTFPSLDQALKGMQPEEVKHLELSFPDNFQEKDLAGKTQDVTLRLTSITATQLPELDDAFAHELKTENLDDLRGSIRKGLETAVEHQIESFVASKLLEEVVARSTVEVADNMWEPIAEHRLRELAEDQVKKGSSLAEYVSKNGITIESLREEWRDLAKQEVKKAVVVREIFTKEGLKIEAGERETELIEWAAEIGHTPEELFALLKKENALFELESRTMNTKVQRFLASKAKFKELAGAGA